MNTGFIMVIIVAVTMVLTLFTMYIIDLVGDTFLPKKKIIHMKYTTINFFTFRVLYRFKPERWDMRYGKKLTYIASGNDIYIDANYFNKILISLYIKHMENKKKRKEDKQQKLVAKKESYKNKELLISGVKEDIQQENLLAQEQMLKAAKIQMGIYTFSSGKFASVYPCLVSRKDIMEIDL